MRHLRITGALFLLLLAAFCFLSSDRQVHAADTGIQEKELYQLTTNKAADRINLVMAVHMDKQNLGVYLPKRASVSVRIKNHSEFSQTLTMIFFNQVNPEEIYQTIPADGSWVSFTAPEDGVPFLATPLNTDVLPIIEYKVSDDAKELVYYRDGVTSQDEFISQWRQSGDSYAVMENDCVTFMVPIADIDVLISNPAVAPANRFDSLAELFQYYMDFRSQYNRYAGLTDTDPASINYNPGGKFFVFANPDGGGWSYIAGDHIALTNRRLQPNFDGYLCRAWTSLHEFGHSYEGGITGSNIHMGDIDNNILGHYFQQTYLSSDELPWIGSIDQVELNAAAFRNSNYEFNDYVHHDGGYEVCLYQFVNLCDKIGPEKFLSASYRYARSYPAETGRKVRDSEPYVYGAGASGYNIIPYLESFSLPVSERSRCDTYEQDLPMLYYIRDLVSTDEEAREISNHLGQKGLLYSLATVDDLKYTGYTSNVSIKIDIDDLSQIAGKNVLIKNGSETAAEIPVTGDTITAVLPIGTYEVELPQTNSLGYRHNYEYIAAKKGTAYAEYSYEKLNENLLAGEKGISICGIGDLEFASLHYDAQSHKIYLNDSGNDPHYAQESWRGQAYASVRITNPSGETVLSQDFIAFATRKQQVLEASAEVGSHILISHKEPSRLLVIDERTQQKDEEYMPSAPDTYEDYVITKYGIMKASWSGEKMKEKYTSTLQSLKDEILASVRSDEIGNVSKNFRKRALLWTAVQSLDEPERSDMMAELKDFFPETANTSAKTKILFTGLGDWQFASLEYSPANRTMTIAGAYGQPHSYFHDSYASVTLKDASGNVKYTKNYVGNQVQQNGTETVNTVPGDKLILYYAEHSRLKFFNGAGEDISSSLQPSEDKVCTEYTVTDSGLVKGRSYASIGQNCQEIRLTGIGDIQFATCIYDMTAGTFTLKTADSVTPHDYFKELYASVMLTSADGSAKLVKGYIGNIRQKKGEETVSVEPGDQLYIYYAEHSRLLFFGSSGENLNGTLQPANDRVFTTYRVGANGLEKTAGE